MFKKALNTFCRCEKSLQRGISAVLTTVRYVLKKHFLSVMDLGRGASKEDRRGNMYENEQSNVPKASIPTERGCCKILPPEYYCSVTHHSSWLSASLLELETSCSRGNNNTITQRTVVYI